MKKCTVRLLAVLLSTLLLSGCTATDFIFSHSDLFRSREVRENIPDFSYMRYIRPDISRFSDDVDELKGLLSSGGEFESIRSLIESCYERFNNFDTMYTIANIRFCQDNSDLFYREEYFWCEENYPVVQQLMEDMYCACGSSDIAEKLERELFWDGFAAEYSAPDASVYTDALISLMQHENELLADYRLLCSSAQIEYKGESRNYNELFSDPGISPAEFNEIIGSYYRRYNGEFSRIYIELIKTRQAIAREMGYESYEIFQYEYSYERDYSPAEARLYMEDIKRFMAPLYSSLSSSEAQLFSPGQEVSHELLLQSVENACRSMDRNIYDAFRFMTEHELCDATVNPSKSHMSFEVYLNDYEVPYVFMDAQGDSYDLLTFSHEFGHYLDAYYNFNAYETLDLSETFSQAMEYLMLFYYEAPLSREDIENLSRLKMLDTLDLYVNQACFAQFESILYSTDPGKLSPQYLNELFLRLSVEYGLCDEGDELSAMSWCDIVHFFEMPFYVISYPVSNDGAMQIYELEKNEPGAGLSKFLELLPREHPGMKDSLEAAGLESPFAQGRIKKVVEDLSNVLVSFEAAA